MDRNRREPPTPRSTGASFVSSKLLPKLPGLKLGRVPLVGNGAVLCPKPPPFLGTSLGNGWDISWKLSISCHALGGLWLKGSPPYRNCDRKLKDW